MRNGTQKHQHISPHLSRKDNTCTWHSNMTFIIILPVMLAANVSAKWLLKSDGSSMPPSCKSAMYHNSWKQYGVCPFCSRYIMLKCTQILQSGDYQACLRCRHTITNWPSLRGNLAFTGILWSSLVRCFWIYCFCFLQVCVHCCSLRVARIFDGR